MSDILNKFDFDDTPGLDKLRNFIQKFTDIGDKAEEAEEKVNKSFKKIADEGEKSEKKFDGVAKSLGKVAGVLGAVAKAGSLAFGGATAGALLLAQYNDRIAEQQKGLGKQWESLRRQLAEKLAPAIYAIQQGASVFLDSASKKVEGLGNSIGVNLGARIIAIGKTTGVFFGELDKRIIKTKLNFQLLGARIVGAFNPLTGNKSKIAALQSAISAMDSQISDLGDTYDEAFTTAQNKLQGLVDNGFFKLRKATKEEIAAAQKLRDQYKKLNDEIQSRLEKSRIDVAEGLKAIDLRKQAAIQEIDLIEERGKKLAEALGVEFEAEEKVAELRKNIEIDFQQERKELIDKTNQEIAKESRQLFKEAFGVYFEDLEELGKKANRAVTDDVLKTARKQNEEIQKKVKKIADSNANVGIFDQFKDSITKSLGLTNDEADLIIGEVGGVLGQVKDLFSANIQARIAENDKLIDSIRSRSDVVREQLEEEEALQKRGRESNVKSKKEELERLRAQEQRALAEREKLLKKQRRADLLANAAEQISSLTTAAANVFKANSKIPVVGVILGIAAVAALFAAFSAAKNKAASTAERLYQGGSLKKTKSFGWVNRLNGRPDKPGQGRGHRVEDSNLVLGGKEMVVQAEAAESQNPSFWDAMNEGKFNNVDLESTVESSLEQRKTNRGFEKREAKIIRITRKAAKEKGLSTETVKKMLDDHAKKIIGYFKSRPERMAINKDTTEIRVYTEFPPKKFTENL